MEELAQWAEARHGVEVTVLPKDLSHPGAGGEVAEELVERGLRADVLINNAGFTQLAPFAEADEAVMLVLLRVNIETLTQLTRRIAPGMVERGRGRIVNMSSNAAFQPGPSMACYYASKAYVLNFSIALVRGAARHRRDGDRAGARPRGHRVPGPRRDGERPTREGPEAPERRSGGRMGLGRGRAWQAVRRVLSRGGSSSRSAMRFLPRATAARLAARTNELV